MLSGFPRRSLWVRLVLVAAALAVIPLAAAKDKKKDEEKGKQGPASPVIARVNGEDVTKAEFDAIVRGNERFFDTTSQRVRDLLRGKPLSDHLFREEVVKIRAVAQANKEALPAMKEAIDKAAERIKAGEDFGAVAKEVCQDASAANGGKQETKQGFAQFVHPFNRTALSLKQGQVGEPILTIFGYHLVKVDKIYPPMEMKPKLVDVSHILIRYPAAGGDWRQQADKWAAEAKVEILDKNYCKKLPSFCAEGGAE